MTLGGERPSSMEADTKSTGPGAGDISLIELTAKQHAAHPHYRIVAVPDTKRTTHMADTIQMPKWGLTMEEGTISEWKVAEGQAITKGELLCVVESEKVAVEMPAPLSGVVLRLLVSAGQTVPVGTAIALVDAE
jgi:glutaconyl-CoA/methylmalonyl-CoA decarboxylase subunit gamma